MSCLSSGCPALEIWSPEAPSDIPVLSAYPSTFVLADRVNEAFGN